MAVVLGALLLPSLAGCGSSTPDPGNGPADRETPGVADDSPAVVNPREIPVKSPVTLTVYSTPPGCLVFVGLVPVRSDNAGLAQTPCAFSLPRGSYAISVERPGGKRTTRQVDVQDETELEFDVSSTPTELDDPSILNAPLFEAAIGRSIPLKALNTADREWDPFLSPDSRTIYFVSDRGGTRGVYTATRPTPYHDFPEPMLIPATGGADQPVSPSVSGDGLILAYAVAEKSRLWQLTRTSLDDPFGAREIIRSDETGERAWRSAQLSGDALRLYWTEEGDDATVTRAAVRSSTGKLFGKTLAFELPGHHPHLSSDGLRQFSFDGTSLRRSRRGSVRQPFGEPETIADIQPEGYSESPRHRQFWVTDDEQWLFYCDNPRSGGDVFVMRLSDGPGWGRSFVAKPVADKMAIAKGEPEEGPKPEPNPADAVDPRTLPLPYTAHWSELVRLLEGSQPDQAVALVRKAQEEPGLREDRQLLAWDLELAEAVNEFHRDVERGLKGLKPGDPIRINGTRFDFQRRDGQTLHVMLKDKEVIRTLKDLSPGELVSVADGPERAEGAKALRFGIFLYFQGKSQHSVAEGWFKRAGDGGAQFHERLAERLLHQATAELSRGNVAAGIAFLDRIETTYGTTQAASRAAEQRGTLYDRLEWKPVGPRKWQRGPLGEFIADPTRANGSYLMSDREYADFELTCEWKVEGPAALGGIYLRYSGQGKPLESGAKIHLANDSDLKRMDRFATGSLFAVAAPSQNASRPAGMWNTLRIQARGPAVQAWINDTQVLQTTLDNEVPARGYVMLDGVAGGICYRKVLLYELTGKPQ